MSPTSNTQEQEAGEMPQEQRSLVLWSISPQGHADYSILTPILDSQLRKLALAKQSHG